MNLVLHLLKELVRYRCSWVIINACSIDFQHFPIENLLCGTDVSDTFEEFLPIAAASKFFQSFIVECKSFDDVFFQPFGCPLSEPCRNDGAHTIAEGNNHVQVIESDFVRLGHALNGTMLTGCSEFPNNCFFLQFAFFEDVFDVFTDIRLTRLI